MELRRVGEFAATDLARNIQRDAVFLAAPAAVAGIILQREAIGLHPGVAAGADRVGPVLLENLAGGAGERMIVVDLEGRHVRRRRRDAR